MTARPSASYRPGTWVAVAGTNTWLLAEIDPAAPLVTRCWEIIQAGGRVDDVLGAIAHEGFRALASFAVAEFDDGVGRLAIRGKATAQIHRAGNDTLDITDHGVAMWISFDVDSTATKVTLTGSGDVDTSLQLPLSSGGDNLIRDHRRP